MTRQRVLITGAAGRVGTMLRSRLARPGRTLRLLDIATPEPPDGADAGAAEEIETITASITGLDAMRAACRDVDAVVHLAGIPTEGRPWSEILEINMGGTQRVLEAARREGVQRVILASSNHAAGFWTHDDAPAGGLPAEAAPRPDTYYGVSKVAMEALGSLYHSRFGIDVVCLRIGTCAPRPTSPRALSTWLSPDDAGRLVEAGLSASGFHVVWGISRNTRRWWSLAEGEAIGYRPVDDAERYAGEILGDAGQPPDFADPELRLLGGSFCTTPLGNPA
jgi:uronate dehydrogenase